MRRTRVKRPGSRRGCRRFRATGRRAPEFLSACETRPDRRRCRARKQIRFANCDQRSAEIRTAFLRQSLFKFRSKILIGPGTAGETDDGALGGEISASGKLKESWYELAMSQVAGRAEEDDRTRLGDPRSGQSFAQRVRIWQRIGARASDELHNRPDSRQTLEDDIMATSTGPPPHRKAS